MLGEALRCVVLGLAGCHQEWPVAALQEQELPGSLIQNLRLRSRCVGMRRDKCFHPAFRRVDDGPHPLRFRVHPREVIAAGAPAGLRERHHAIGIVRFDECGCGRQVHRVRCGQEAQDFLDPVDALEPPMPE